MPGSNSPYTALDASQVLRQSFDEVNDRIRVDAVVSTTITDVTIIDPITGYSLHINADGSIDVNTVISAPDGDSVKSWVHDGIGNPITSSISNANRLLHIQAPDTFSSTFTLGALNATGSVSLSGLTSIGFQLNAGSFIGTIIAEVSVDGGSNWVTVPFYDPLNSALLTNLAFSSANPLKIVSIVPIGGSSHARVRVSSYTSGSATGLLRVSEVTGSVGAITASAFEVATNTYVAVPTNTTTLLLASNVNRKYAYFSNNSSSLLNIQFGSGTGLTPVTGLIIQPQTFYELKGDNLFTGNVYGHCASNITVSVTEGTPT